VLGSQTFLYDGLGRCTQQTDALHHTTHFSYDPWSRMVSSTLPDKSVVTREYALHSSAELPIALRVLHPDGDTLTVAGEQVFDGLERMTQVKVGKRIEQYAYDGDSMQVRRRTTAAGDTIDFAYNLMLTDQPVSSTALDEHA
jgi:YD repeat-containing protein